MNVTHIMEDVNISVMTLMEAISVPVTLAIIQCLVLALVNKVTLFLCYESDIDVDECSLGIDGCHQNCVNTNGSYLCYCNAGYHLLSDQKNCAGNVN